MRLRDFDNSDFSRGAPAFLEALWIAVQFLVLRSPIPGSFQRVVCLRIFGADIGRGVVIKPGVKIKFPWKLSIGDYTWIGEGAWIDNLAKVSVGSNCCISQGAYLCTGSHDWSSSRFDLITKQITLNDKCWIGAKSTLSPGVEIGEGAVVALGSVMLTDADPWFVYSGAPAVRRKQRVVLE